MEDEFIKDLHDAFEDPQKFKGSNNLYAIRADNRSHVAKALLLSPQLKKYEILVEVWKHLSSAEFYRELKNPEVRDRVRNLILTNFPKVRLAEISNYYKNDLIHLKEFGQYLDDLHKMRSQSRSPSQQTLTKGSYFSFISDLATESMDNFSYSLIYKFMDACTAHSIKNLQNLVDNNKEMKSDLYLNLISNLYKDFLSKDLPLNRHMMEGSHSKQLCKLLWKIIFSRNASKQTPYSIDLNSVYKDMQVVGLTNPNIPHKCYLGLKETKNFIEFNNFCENLASVRSDEAFKYFVLNLTLRGPWNAKGHPDNPETKVVSRLNSLNSAVFAATGRCWYNRTELDVNPKIYPQKRSGSGNMSKKDLEALSKSFATGFLVN
jgi:hypothetical protein